MIFLLNKYRKNIEIMTRSIINSSSYRFTVLEQSEVLKYRELLKDEAMQYGENLRGTILLSLEGINICLSGTKDAIYSYQKYINNLHPTWHDIIYKDSYSDKITLKRMLVKIKKELISMGVETVQPAINGLEDHISPEEFKEWYDKKKDMLVLDTRNDYEVRLGTFDQAYDLNIKSFRDFPIQIDTQLKNVPKDKQIVMFCTGGIRCEKAAYSMIEKGYTNVKQLDGGILKYFEKCGGKYYNGECFVFDDRVTVTNELKQGKDFKICFACRAPLNKEQQKLDSYIEGKSCVYCFHGKDDFRSSEYIEKLEKSTNNKLIKESEPEPIIEM